jgi:hypothetical protein
MRASTAIPAQEINVALATAAVQTAPDRTTLPILGPKLGGVAARAMDKPKGDWPITASVKVPDGAPNVLADRTLTMGALVETSWEKRDLLPTPDRAIMGVAVRYLQ